VRNTSFYIGKIGPVTGENLSIVESKGLLW
jgi:hypothetical protein